MAPRESCLLSDVVAIELQNQERPIPGLQKYCIRAAISLNLAALMLHSFWRPGLHRVTPWASACATAITASP